MCAVVNLLFAAIELVGVSGSNLSARAFFDANNVKVGDPIILTVDFIGSADFKDLHPPALSRAVLKKDWKIDDLSAKTDTFLDARRLTYRVRPMREGVLWFPALEFSFTDPSGESRLVRSNEIPVHATLGDQVVLNGLEESADEGFPQPPELITELDSDDDDILFKWRRALSKPSAEVFAAFDFPAAKMNEATMAIKEGNWARAMTIYSQLEWFIGQTPAIERGIIAALALKNDDAAAELPAWRVVLRPLLKYAWRGRLIAVLSLAFALSLLFFVFGRLARALAVIAFALLIVTPASAETIESVTTNANGMIVYRKVTTSGKVSGIEPASFFDRMRNRKPVKIDVSLTPDRGELTVGERFELTLSVDMPRYVNFDSGIRLSIAEQPSMTQIGSTRQLPAIASKNPTNNVQRLVFPMRADAVFTNLNFTVDGAYSFAGDSFFFRQTYPYSSGIKTAPLVVKPLPAEGRPEDFSGIIAENVGLSEYCDILTPSTNDVITINYKLRTSGIVPDDFLPKDVAFAWRQGEWQRYFVADGAPKTPEFSIFYYDPAAKSYKRVTTGGTPLAYK